MIAPLALGRTISTTLLHTTPNRRNVRFFFFYNIGHMTFSFRCYRSLYHHVYLPFFLVLVLCSAGILIVLCICILLFLGLRIEGDGASC